MDDAKKKKKGDERKMRNPIEGAHRVIRKEREKETKQWHFLMGKQNEGKKN